MLKRYRKYYDNGVLQDEWFEMDGKKYGTQRRWYANGVLTDYIEWYRGVPCGLDIGWNTLGELDSIRKLKYGLLAGDVVMFHSIRQQRIWPSLVAEEGIQRGHLPLVIPFSYLPKTVDTLYEIGLDKDEIYELVLDEVQQNWAELPDWVAWFKESVTVETIGVYLRCMNEEGMATPGWSDSGKSAPVSMNFGKRSALSTSETGLLGEYSAVMGVVNWIKRNPKK